MSMKNEIVQLKQQKRTVTVLMSTYNGEQFLREQVESVLYQENVDSRILVRDDGSTDNTLALLFELAEIYPGKLEVIRGRNLGPTGSFLELSRKAEGRSHWYAFCDQDDVWLPEKLSRALDKLAKYGDSKNSIYASATTICDANLNIISNNTFPKLKFDLGAELSRHRLPGHVLVFDQSLLHELNSFNTNFNFPHDYLLCVVACACGSKFVFDSKSEVLHRRLSSSVTPGGNGLVKRIKHELAQILNKNGLDRAKLANRLLTRYGSDLNAADKVLLDTIVRGNRLNKMVALIKGKLACGLAMGDIETLVSILLGTF